MSFTVVIVGRPNVGKSTLFNRLAGKKLALVDDTPGVTRDRREGDGHVGDLSFRIVDTAGLEEGAAATLSGRMRKQTESAFAAADFALMLIDARAGVTPMDQHFADWIRKISIPVILAVNKCEGKAGEAGLYEAFSLGLGEPVPISAEHGEGMAELYQAFLGMADKLGLDTSPGTQDEEETAAFPHDLEEGDLEYEFREAEQATRGPVNLSIVGRPNAGKSTLINHMIGEDRMITGPEPGLTRDSIGIDWAYQGRAIKLFDTAGLRKKARVINKLEKLSVADSLRAIRFAHVVVLLLDAELGFEKQDVKIADRVITEGRALVIGVNKWDLPEDRSKVTAKIDDVIERTMPRAKGLPVVYFSARTGKGVEKLMAAVMKAYDQWNSRVSTSPFNRWLAATIDKHPPPAPKGNRIKIRYGAQIKARPPTFALFANRPEVLPASYINYMENELRKAFNLWGTPIRFLFRKTKNPFRPKK